MYAYTGAHHIVRPCACARAARLRFAAQRRGAYLAMRAAAAAHQRHGALHRDTLEPQWPKASHVLTAIALLRARPLTI